MQYRVILFHKQATSARTRFLRFGRSVCAPEPLPTLARISQENSARTVLHPSWVVCDIEETFGFEAGSLSPEGEFYQAVEVPGWTIQIILLAITTIDPPFDLAERAGARFIDLTEARDLPAVELELLRAAYEMVLGG